MTKRSVSNYFLYFNVHTEEWMAIPRDNVSKFMNDYLLPSKHSDLKVLLKLIEDGKAKR